MKMFYISGTNMSFQTISSERLFSPQGQLNLLKLCHNVQSYTGQEDIHIVQLFRKLKDNVCSCNLVKCWNKTRVYFEPVLAQSISQRKIYNL